MITRNLTLMIAIVAMVTGCIEQTKTVPVQTLQSEIDKAQLEYIIDVLEKNDLMMDSVGNIIPMNY